MQHERSSAFAGRGDRIGFRLETENQWVQKALDSAPTHYSGFNYAPHISQAIHIEGWNQFMQNVVLRPFIEGTKQAGLGDCCADAAIDRRDCG